MLTGILVIIVAAAIVAGGLILRLAFQELTDLHEETYHLGTKVRQLMTDVASVKQLIADLNDETNTVAAKVDSQQTQIKALQDQIAAGGTVTAADLQAIADGLTPISERLKALGADPTQPIPPAA